MKLIFNTLIFNHLILNTFFDAHQGFHEKKALLVVKKTYLRVFEAIILIVSRFGISFPSLLCEKEMFFFCYYLFQNFK